MVIKDTESYKNFLQDNWNSDLIMDCIQNDECFHPCADEPCLLMIYTIKSKQTYIISVDHPDSRFCVDKTTLIEDFNKLKGKKWIYDKKKFMHLMPVQNLYDINILFFITDGKIDDYTGFDTTAHSFYKHKFMCYSDLNKCIPIVKHLEKFEKMYSEMLKRVQMLKLDDSFYSINGTITENLRILEHNGLKVDVELFNRHFENKTVKDKDGYVYTQYNLYTATGRPSNRFGNVNYSALNKENGCRSSFISRYGDDGMLFMIDYSAYHPHIVAKLINYNLPPNAYEYLGRLYYGKDSLTEDEIKASKNLTFQCMYGNIPSELLEVPYYKKMNDYIAHRWKFFNENGYVETPIYKRRITTNHINEPNPNKLFNYILQASETEFGMQSLVRVNEYLECNKKQTKAILYTYDSVLFDCHKGDKKETLVELKRLMSNNQFPVKCYIGRNYNEMTVVDI